MSLFGDLHGFSASQKIDPCILSALSESSPAKAGQAVFYSSLKRCVHTVGPSGLNFRRSTSGYGCKIRLVSLKNTLWVIPTIKFKQLLGNKQKLLPRYIL